MRRTCPENRYLFPAFSGRFQVSRGNIPPYSAWRVNVRPSQGQWCLLRVQGDWSFHPTIGAGLQRRERLGHMTIQDFDGHLCPPIEVEASPLCCWKGYILHVLPGADGCGEDTRFQAASAVLHDWVGVERSEV